MKQKISRLLMTLALLVTAASGAWAQEYDIHIDFQDHTYNPNETTFRCEIRNGMDLGAEPKGTLEVSVDGALKGSFAVDGEMVEGKIKPGVDAGNHTWTAVFKPERGVAFIANGNFTINKASAEIQYDGPTSINLGVGESTELDANIISNIIPEGGVGQLSYSSSDAYVASITKG